LWCDHAGRRGPVGGVAVGTRLASRQPVTLAVVLVRRAVVWSTTEAPPRFGWVRQ
jgi:hypothetical protein